VATSSLKTEHSEATRAAIVKSARALFARRGYQDVSVRQIVERARVTRGALYHHFEDKRELFATVCEELEAEIERRVYEAVTREPDAWKSLMVGLEVFLDTCMEPDVQQILFGDAQSVLGARRVHEMDSRHGLGLVAGGLERAMAAGVVARQPVGPLAHLLLGALMAGSGLIGRAADAETARSEVGRGLERLLEGLRPSVVSRQSSVISRQ
jgi:AcrR family transcriptional regulator